MVFASSEGRTPLIHSIQHLAPVPKRWWHATRNHLGTVVSQQVPLGEGLGRMRRPLGTVMAHWMENSLT